MRGNRNSRRRNTPYVGKKSARIGFFAGIGAALMILAATACVALAVFIMLDYSLPIGNGFFASGDAQPAFVPAPAPIVELPQPEILIAPEAPTDFPRYETGHLPIQDLPTYAEAYTYLPDSWMPELSDVPGYTIGNPSSAPEPTPTPAPTPEPIHRLPPRVANMNAFSVLPFYIPGNAALYAEFYAERPDLDVETVVWKVNVSLHLPFYTGIQTVYDPYPLLVTPFFRLPSGFAPAYMVPVNNDNCHLRATPQTVYAFHRLRDAAQRDGFNLSVTSAFRSAARQRELWEAGGRRDGAIARPYHSEHQTGRALDLWGPAGLLDRDGPSPTGLWVAANAHYFGFLVRYRAETTHITGYIHEPWHITYVGFDISMYMHNNNILSLEEFVGRNPWITLNHY
ncbi:MAG: M15 family metallopeptidase [Defluviitaleaceae bacterium]|nr:M15 family metallopeptidase [Defluviitaleaceae bacterium]